MTDIIHDPGRGAPLAKVRFYRSRDNREVDDDDDVDVGLEWGVGLCARAATLAARGALRPSTSLERAGNGHERATETDFDVFSPRNR